MREVEVKAVVADWEGTRQRVIAAGGECTFEGRLEDRRYDTPAHDIQKRGEVLRLRVYRASGEARAQIGWKGPTSFEGGYKVREEIETEVTDADALLQVFQRLGYVVTYAIDRQIVQYELDGTTIRFERYPRMDDLVEVEGTPEGIERAVAVMGMARDQFTAERLPDFMRRYNKRTGTAAAVSDDELAGKVHYPPEDG